MASPDLDEAVLVIQEAATKISSVSTKFEDFEGKQDELISTVKFLSERVADLEKSSQQKGAKPKKKLDHPVQPYERVCLFIYIPMKLYYNCLFPEYSKSSV